MDDILQYFLNNTDTQEQIDKIAKKYQNKKIVIYGAGKFAKIIFENYDLSRLNILAIVDKKFENEEEKGFFGYECISPDELESFECDILLIANFNTRFFSKTLEKVFSNKKKDIKILPLIEIPESVYRLPINAKAKIEHRNCVDNPKISVILPIYNVENYLSIALDSLLNQTFKDIEIICVDDCSTDNSYNIALDYEKNHSCIKVFRQPKNMGEVVAKFCGAQKAKADYIGTLDPDDWAHPEMYEKLYSKIISTNSDIVVSNYRVIEEDNRFHRDIRMFVQAEQGSILFGKDIINRLNPATTNKLIKKEIYLNALNFTERDVWKDIYQFWRGTTLKECKIAFVDEFLYYYRIRKDSITHTPMAESEIFRNFYKTIDLILEYLITNNCNKDYLDAVKEKISRVYRGKNNYNYEDYKKLEEKYALPSGFLSIK